MDTTFTLEKEERLKYGTLPALHQDTNLCEVDSQPVNYSWDTNFSNVNHFAIYVHLSHPMTPIFQTQRVAKPSRVPYFEYLLKYFLVFLTYAWIIIPLVRAEADGNST